MDSETVDVEITDHGSIVTFRPLTPAAEAWFDQHVQAEPWQWLGSALAVEHRLGSHLLGGILDAGLTIRG